MELTMYTTIPASRASLRSFIVSACMGVPVRVMPSVPARRAARRAARLASVKAALAAMGYRV